MTINKIWVISVPCGTCTFVVGVLTFPFLGLFDYAEISEGALSMVDLCGPPSSFDLIRFISSDT